MVHCGLAHGLLSVCCVSGVLRAPWHVSCRLYLSLWCRLSISRGVGWVGTLGQTTSAETLYKQCTVRLNGKLQSCAMLTLWPLDVTCAEVSSTTYLTGSCAMRACAHALCACFLPMQWSLMRLLSLYVPGAWCFFCISSLFASPLPGASLLSVHFPALSCRSLLHTATPTPR